MSMFDMAYFTCTQLTQQLQNETYGLPQVGVANDS
jgi:hypothetical protein